MENLKTAEQMNDEIERLNALVEAEKARIEELYPLIGKAYCEAYSDAPAEAVAALVGAVSEGNRTIKDHTEAIKRCNKALGVLRGVVDCPNCAKEVSIHAAFCSSCGTSMSAALLDLASEDDIICPVCGLATPHGSLFCEKCGAKIGNQADNAPDAPATEVKTEHICPSCGTVAEDGDLFCPGCGEKMPTA